MARKVRIVTDVEIIDISDKGKGIGKAPDGRILLVDQVVPGDILDVRVLRKRKGMLQGIPEEMHTLSAHRTRPFCKHFGTCGGCKWQNLAYESQLYYKEKSVRDALTRISGIDQPDVRPIAASDRQKAYRNKLEYTFTDQRWLTETELNSDVTYDRRGLGFHVPGAFARVLDLDECFLQPEPSNEIRLLVRDICLRHELAYQNIRERSGLMRNLIVRNNERGEVMVIIIFLKDDPAARKLLFEEIQERFPQVISCYYCINEKLNDSYYDLDMHLFSGSVKLRQQLGHVRFDMGPKSFYQTNPDQARVLYDVTKELAGLRGDEVVLDLYCGIGSISLYVADQCAYVIGIEEVEAAIHDARDNARLNNYDHVRFYAGDAKALLQQAVRTEHGRPDVIITDPPRAGMHASVVQQIQEAAPLRIIYVSCNPSTQARDIAMLSEQYEFITAQPVDMFPHTSHIENVALLQRKA